MFILFSVSLWTYEEYYYYAGVIFVTSAISIIINLYQIRKLNEKIFHMAFYTIPVNVLRNGNVVNISSYELVPGDVVFLKDPVKLPFEGIIMEGSALIN
jgi:cation-transporting ATPase 13A2